MAFDLQAFHAELTAWAAERSGPVETRRYGAHPEQVADLRLPEGQGPHPVAVLIHGGFWRAPFTRSLTAALAVDVAQRGFAAWNMEYRRLGCGGGVPATLEDVEAALRALEEIDAPLDIARTIAIGHSAGGHLALWAAGTGRIAAVVSLAGICDLAAAARAGLGGGAAAEFAGGPPEQRPEAYDLADPSRRLPVGVPQLLVHGDRDDRVPVEQSRRYAERARCELLELPGVGHFELIDPRSDAWAQAAGRIPALA